MTENEKIIYKSSLYPRNNKPFSILQEYSARAYLFFFTFWAAGLYVIIARHMPVLWYGVGGIFAIFFLSNIGGMVKAKMQYVEIGFRGEFFYMVNIYDIAFKKEISYYPMTFANVSREGLNMFINYHGQIIRLKRDDWSNWNELYSAFFFQSNMESNIDIA